MDTTESMIMAIDRLQGPNMGELDQMAVVKGLMITIDTLLNAYLNNSFGKPSTSLNLTKKFDEVQKSFNKVIRVSTKITEIDIRIKECKYNLIREPNLQYEIIPLQNNLEMHLADYVGALGLDCGQMKYTVRDLQNTVVSEFTLINANIDIRKERMRVKRTRKEGISYSIDFKLLPKDKQLNINKSKEVPSNDTKRGKSSR